MSSPDENIKNYIKNVPISTNAEADKRILGELLRELEKTSGASEVETPSIWRTIMITRITKLAAAAVIIIAVVLGISLFNKSIPTVSAAEILSDAVKALPDFKSIHIKAMMRTLPQDNFSYIGLDKDFVPIELWKKVGDDGTIKWKVEKPGRLLLMDGNSTTFVIKPNHVRKSGPTPNIGGYDCGWFGRLVNVKNLIESESQNVQKADNTQLCIGHETINGRDKVVLDVDYATKGDADDYLKNKFIDTSDHTKVYQFDAETKLLEGFKIIVHKGQDDVVVFETTAIEYDPVIDDKVFALELPDNVIQFKDAETLPDNEKYAAMGPKETAQAFFEACATENWDEFLKFWMTSAVDPGLKKYLGGLTIISIGEPFKSKLIPGYGGWFVPYEIKLKSGEIKKWNLAVRNDNPAKRYVVDGGI